MALKINIDYALFFSWTLLLLSVVLQVSSQWGTVHAVQGTLLFLQGWILGVGIEQWLTNRRFKRMSDHFERYIKMDQEHTNFLLKENLKLRQALQTRVS